MRIRTIKPEFFDSPDTAKCSPWARLLYIAMWCMSDDWGVGPANEREMIASAFPNDYEIGNKELPSLCKEIADNYGVLFYTNRGRRFFQIPSWDKHQVTQRRAKRKYPTADDPESTPDQGVYESPCIDKELPCERKETASTEQGKGNRGKGTGEQVLTSHVASDDDDDVAPLEAEIIERPEIEGLLDQLEDRIRANGNRPGNRTKTAHDAIRRMIDIDGYTVEQIRFIIDWSQTSEFWQANILSAKKLRDKMPTLIAQARRDSRKPMSRDEEAARALDPNVTYLPAWA